MKHLFFHLITTVASVTEVKNTNSNLNHEQKINSERNTPLEHTCVLNIKNLCLDALYKACENNHQITCCKQLKIKASQKCGNFINSIYTDNVKHQNSLAGASDHDNQDNYQANNQKSGSVVVQATKFILTENSDMSDLQYQYTKDNQQYFKLNQNQPSLVFTCDNYILSKIKGFKKAERRAYHKNNNKNNKNKKASISAEIDQSRQSTKELTRNSQLDPGNQTFNSNFDETIGQISVNSKDNASDTTEIKDPQKSPTSETPEPTSDPEIFIDEITLEKRTKQNYQKIGQVDPDLIDFHENLSVRHKRSESRNSNFDQSNLSANKYAIQASPDYPNSECSHICSQELDTWEPNCETYYKYTYTANAANTRKKSDNFEASFSNGGALVFVIISFIVLMLIVIAWLLSFYIQNYRQRRLHVRISKRRKELAKKAMARIPTKILDEKDLADTSSLDSKSALTIGNLDTETKTSISDLKDENNNHTSSKSPFLSNSPKNPGKISFKYNDTACAICIDQHKLGDCVRILPCKHIFHKKCVDPWLFERQNCPIGEESCGGFPKNWRFWCVCSSKISKFYPTKPSLLFAN